MEGAWLCSEAGVGFGGRLQFARVELVRRARGRLGTATYRCVLRALGRGIGAGAGAGRGDGCRGHEEGMGPLRAGGREECGGSVGYCSRCVGLVEC